MVNDYDQYWNDLEAEKRKVYHIDSIDDMKLLNWLREDTNLQCCLEDAATYSQTNFGGIKGQVLDVGAGVCWSSSIIANLSSVEQVTAIDFSKHRVDSFAALVIEQFHADPSKINRIHGDFLKYPFSENSFDAILFCQSLYMFANLHSTLKHAFHLIKPGGQLIVACEGRTGSIYQLLKNRKLISTANRGKCEVMTKLGLSKKCDASGRYAYQDSDYGRSISRTGMDCHRQQLDYLLYPFDPILTFNYFGLKAVDKK